MNIGGSKTLKEIKKYQRSTDFLLPKIAFRCLVWELVQDQVEKNHTMAGVDFPLVGQLSEDAFDALQTVTENQMVKIFGSKY